MTTIKLSSRELHSPTPQATLWWCARTQVAAAAQSGTLTKLTIPELKCYLKAEGLAIKGKKEELVARVQLQLGGGGLDAAAPVPPHALV